MRFISPTKCFALCSAGVNRRPSANASSNALLASTSGSTFGFGGGVGAAGAVSTRATRMSGSGNGSASRADAHRGRGLRENLLRQRLGARVFGKDGANALDGRARVVEAALIERGLAAAHEIVRDFRQTVAGGDVVRLRLQYAREQRPGAELLGLDQHAGLVRELRHAQRVVERRVGRKSGSVAGSCLDLGRQCRRRRR